MKGMTWGRRVKRVVLKGFTAHMRTLKWQGSIDHVILMAVINAAGQAFTAPPLPVTEFLRQRGKSQRGKQTMIEERYKPQLLARV